MKHAKQKARTLRKEQTKAEKLLWSKLRNNQLNGFKFRRQYPIDNYILDFYCHEAKLAIELDGSQHAEAYQALYDKIRTLHLESLNVTVLRFWNSEVSSSINNVLETITSLLTKC